MYHTYTSLSMYFCIGSRFLILLAQRNCIWECDFEHFFSIFSTCLAYLKLVLFIQKNCTPVGNYIKEK